MANNYVQAAFLVPVTDQEAWLVKECDEVSRELNTTIDNLVDAKSYYASLSDEFKSIFPPRPEEEDPFASFYDLFDDPDFPTFDCDIIASENEAGNGMAVYFGGEQMDVHAVASLIQTVCKSALPFGFEWATTCSKLRPGEFGGGFYVITEDAIKGGSTHEYMSELLREEQARVTEVQAHLGGIAKH